MNPIKALKFSKLPEMLVRFLSLDAIESLKSARKIKVLSSSVHPVSWGIVKVNSQEIGRAHV